MALVPFQRMKTKVGDQKIRIRDSIRSAIEEDLVSDEAAPPEVDDYPLHLANEGFIATSNSVIDVNFYIDLKGSLPVTSRRNNDFV